MGRRDSVQVTLEVVARMRQLLPALVVSYEPGWETRGNGTSPNYEGGLVHHTASATSLARPFPTQTVLRQGRSDLPGPLCNFAGPACTTDAPRLHVMAAPPANHAGASGGRSMGPLPRTSLFNPRVLGLEIDYAGTVPMLAGQLLVAHVWSRAVADVVGGGDIERVRAHFETSVTGKWDIGAGAGSVDMADFRRRAASIATTQGDSMSAAEVQDLKNYIDAAVVVRAQQLMDRQGLFKIYKLAGTQHHAAAAPGCWVPMPDANPAGYAALLIGRRLAAGEIFELPAPEWDYLRSVCLAPQAGDVDTGGLVQRIIEALPAAQVDAAVKAAKADQEAQAKATADEIDRRSRERLAQTTS